MIDWRKKLTSRKFWVSLAGFAAGLVVIFGGTKETADKISGSLLSGAAVISYIIGEGMTDSAVAANTPPAERTDNKEEYL